MEPDRQGVRILAEKVSNAKIGQVKYRHTEVSDLVEINVSNLIFFSNPANTNSNMKLALVLIFCIAIAAAKSIPDEVERQGGNFNDLTKEQRQCIIDATQRDVSIMGQLKKCHESGGGLDCVKKIPALKSCFA